MLDSTAKYLETVKSIDLYAYFHVIDAAFFFGKISDSERSSLLVKYHQLKDEETKKLMQRVAGN